MAQGLLTEQFEEALMVLPGPRAGGLSPTTIRRLVEVWQGEHKRWQGRDLSPKRYVYVWAEGVCFSPRLEHERQCILVLIGADASGKKELLAIDDGFRESERSWHELLVRLRDENALTIDPELATAEEALGFWKAVRHQVPRWRTHQTSRGSRRRMIPIHKICA
jgi:transposase-like protein